MNISALCQDVIRNIQKFFAYRDALTFSRSCKQYKSDLVLSTYILKVIAIQRAWKLNRARLKCRNLFADRIFQEPTFRSNYVVFHEGHFCIERKFYTSKWLQVIYNNNIDNAIEQFSNDLRYERVIYELLEPGSSPTFILENSVYFSMDSDSESESG